MTRFDVALKIFTQAIKGGAGSGWHAPPKGTHGAGSQGGTITFFHVTSSASKIESEGFDLSQAGIQGGSQLGQGVYLGRNPEYWRMNLGYGPRPTELLRVDIDMSKVADLDRVKFDERFDHWAEQVGYLQPQGGGATQKFVDLIEQFGGWQDDALWQVKTEFLRSQGYHGLYDRRGDNLVIWNPAAIGEIKQIGWDEWREWRQE